MLKDIETVEWYFGNSLKAKEVAPSWNRIKKFCEEAQKSSNNSEKHQCSRDTLVDHDTYFSCSVCHKMFPAEDIVGD